MAVRIGGASTKINVVATIASMPSQPSDPPRGDPIISARFLTFSCFRRQPFLTRERSRRWLVDALARSRETHGFHLWAWVIMPEHVHLLLWPGASPAKLSSSLYTVKKSVSSRAIAFVRVNAPGFLANMADIDDTGAVTHRFWQRGRGYDRDEFSPEEIWEKIDYIHANPVSRGLCAHPTDWDWSSARAFVARNSGPLRLDLDSLPAPPPDYRPPF